MPQLLFEGKKKVKKVRRQKEIEVFEAAKEKFGFKEEIDLFSFCSAIALFRENRGDQFIKEKPSLQEMTNMYSFRKADLYDLIVLHYLDIHEGRLEEFEKYFYSGFKYLNDWLEDFGADYNTSIELVCKFWEDLIGDER